MKVTMLILLKLMCKEACMHIGSNFNEFLTSFNRNESRIYHLVIEGFLFLGSNFSFQELSLA